jgi:hypothetical protein
MQNTLERYYFLGPTWFSRHGRKYIHWDLAYLFLHAHYYDRLVPSSRVDEHDRQTAQYLQAIPHAEAWIENKIPLEWIERALLVKIREPAPDRNTPSGRHYWSVLKAWEKHERARK